MFDKRIRAASGASSTLAIVTKPCRRKKLWARRELELIDRRPDAALGALPPLFQQRDAQDRDTEDQAGQADPARQQSDRPLRIAVQDEERQGDQCRADDDRARRAPDRIDREEVAASALSAERV